ncbi:MAG: hypothetical protein RLZZ543_1738 [Bacteroidota bacterium]|jgi:tetratricopeptide (TPR) repeat protein
MFKRLLPLFLLALIIASCKSTVSYTGLRPADVNLPQEVKSVVLVNRYKATRQNNWMNIVEGIFTGEVIFADKRGVEQALSGLQQRLQNGPKYAVSIASDQLNGTGTGVLPPPLNQADIIQLCTQYNADAVIALEAFDSDIAVTSQPKTRKRTENGVTFEETYFEAWENVRITMAWRLYLKSTGAVFDQNQMTTNRGFSNTGKTDIIARNGLLFPVDAIMQTGFQGGDAYGVRVAPSWVTYTREIYTRAARSKTMKQAKRMAYRTDWAEAAKIWETLSKSPNDKVAKRATYNRAVAAEMLGNYDEALEWARKAANTYGMRNADNYIITLKARLNELQRLDQQMKE